MFHLRSLEGQIYRTLFLLLNMTFQLHKLMYYDNLMWKGNTTIKAVKTQNIHQ